MNELRINPEVLKLLPGLFVVGDNIREKTKKEFFENNLYETYSNFYVEGLKREKGKYYFLCLCICGKTNYHRREAVLSGETKSCCQTPVLKDEKNRFLDFVMENTVGCWIWQRPKDQKGYGRFTSKLFPEETKAHRISYLMFKRNINIRNKFILHKCHTPSCVNPDHLVRGDHNSNMKHMVNANRQARGENAKHTYSEQQVKEVKLLLENNKSSIQIHNMTGIGKSAIQHIKHNRCWAHLN